MQYRNIGCNFFLLSNYIGILNIVLANSRNYRTIGYQINASIYQTIGYRTQKNYRLPTSADESSGQLAVDACASGKRSKVKGCY
jgi:hypothetical protein